MKDPLIDMGGSFFVQIKYLDNEGYLYYNG